MRLYVQQKHLFGAQDRCGSLNEIMNIVCRIYWAQGQLALNQEVAGEGSTKSVTAGAETL